MSHQPPPLIFPPARGVFTVLPLGVIDGDTVKVAYLLQDTVRLFGINAPEMKGASQAAGLASKKFLEMLVLTGGTLTVEVVNREKYGRALSKVTLPDGRDVAQALVENGHAVAWDGHGKRPE